MFTIFNSSLALKEPSMGRAFNGVVDFSLLLGRNRDSAKKALDVTTCLNVFLFVF